MKPVTFLQKLMVWFLISLLVALFFYVAIVKLASLTYADDIMTQVEAALSEAGSYELVLDLHDGKVQMYRYERRGEICYLAVGYLHGYTIALDCLK
jgi:hypothetical protein